MPLKETFTQRLATFQVSSESKEPISADPQGQVALMLCESLLHVLVDRGFITKDTGMEAIETVRDVTREMVNDEPTPANRMAAELVAEILQSFHAK